MKEHGVQQVNKAKLNAAKDRMTTRSLIPLVALGGGLAAGPAAALELGELTVHSNLGQPLRASIAYALAPNEMLADTCVSINAGRSTGGLPGVGPSAISITESAIVITGKAAVREPMLGTRVTISCPYTPNLSREYMLFVDPAPVADARAADAALVVARPEAHSEPEGATYPEGTQIGQSSRYQVQRGETLGDIVRRIENRSMSLWPAVNLVFEANPDAFIDNDPNKLKAGSRLTIPSFDGAVPVVATTTVGTAVAPTEEPAVTETPAAGESAATAAEAISAYDPTATSEVIESPVEEPVAIDSTADLQPGDVILGNDTVVEPAATIAIPDTQLEGPETTSSSPNVPTAVISTGARSESTSLLAWLVGGGLAIIFALVLFGRRVRNRFAPTPVGPVATASTHAVDETAPAEAIAADNYDIEDDSPTEENLALDANVITGDGFEQGTDMDVSQDFGFAATTNLDIELPAESDTGTSELETDIIPPVRSDIESILESEVLPEDDDYDMSVIVDATQMPQPEDVTEHDLKAVEVGADDQTLIADNYTISREVDYDILEQDYEDELTATQALNLEIERAATELAADLNEPHADDHTSELDSTTDLPAGEDEKTAEFEAAYDPNDTNAVTVNMSHEDKTAEMPVANDDETTEMEIESGRVDTK